MTIYALIGVVGVGLYLFAYAALQAGLIRGRGYTYILMNMAAAACVLVSLIEHFNLSSAMIQISWITISIFGLTRSYLLNRRLKFSADEELLAERAFPGVDRLDLRKLINAGDWTTGTSGDVLIREGEAVDYLYWLVEGSCTIRVAGREVAVTDCHGLLGEVTALNGSPATGSVVLRERSRYFRLPADVLREAADRDPDLRYSLQSSFHNHMQQKLLRANHAFADLREQVDLKKPPVAAVDMARD
jgi:hypothetical protein